MDLTPLRWKESEMATHLWIVWNPGHGGVDASGKTRAEAIKNACAAGDSWAFLRHCGYRVDLFKRVRVAPQRKPKRRVRR